jgi:hypothetical protein
MAVLRLDRFTIDPARSEEQLSRHATLVVTDAFPGLFGVELANVDRTGIDVWRWIPFASAQTALGGAPSIPQARRRSPSPQTSPLNTPRSSMPDRNRPATGRLTRQ